MRNDQTKVIRDNYMWVRNWKISAFLTLNFLFVLSVNSDVLFDLLDEWLSAGPYNHGLLGLGLALYVIYIKKEAFAYPRYNFPSLIPLCAASLLLLVANLASIGQLQLLALFLVMVALLFSLYGIKIINTLFIPLLMIFLTLPVWNVVQIPLRDISTWVSFHSVEILGLAIIRDGYNLITPAGAFLVAESCSGLGFFLASALYAVFIAQMNHLSRKAAALYLLLAVLVAIIANWIRITVIIIVGSQTAMQHFIVQDHLTFGWLVFAACFIPLIIIGHIYFGERTVDNIDQKKIIEQTKDVNKWHLVSISLILLFFAAMSQIISSRFDPEYKFTLPAVPHYAQIDLNSTASHNWFPTSKGATSEEFSYFSQGDNLLQVYLANYAKQRQGSEMIFVENSLFDKNRWFNVKEQTIELPPASVLKRFKLLTLRRNNYRSRIIAYWYLVDGHYIADKKMAKWYEVQAAIKGQPGATLIAIGFDYNNEDKEQALKTMTDFASAFSAQPITIQKSI